MAEMIIAGCVRDRSAAQAIKKLNCQFVGYSSIQRMGKAELPGGPSLFLLQSSAQDIESVVALLQRLRRERPLTEIVVWNPGGGGGSVRTLFRAGAKDVVVAKSTSSLVESIELLLSEQRILPRVNQLARKRGRDSRFESMLSRSQSMWDLFELCDQVASTEATVLIVGETGTGKELLARALHRRSSRPGRLVVANCASIPPDLVNSELCGHEKGAFTGAERAKKGLVAHAQGGTLFLDEIGDMPLEAQQSLLRILQERKVRPVGGLSEEDVDVRVIAATNVALDGAVLKGRFREDLFYRLDVIRMQVPPLRERPEDILFLFGHFIKQLSKHYGRTLPTYSDDFLDCLVADPWNGNVRQLENFAERLVLSNPRRILKGRDFARLMSAKSAQAKDVELRATRMPTSYSVELNAEQSLDDNIQPVVERLEREYILELLKQTSGRIAETASRAGISRRTLLRKMKLYGVDKTAFKTE